MKSGQSENMSEKINRVNGVFVSNHSPTLAEFLLAN